MRILHAIESLDPAGGGPPSIAARIAAAQATLGHCAEVLCYESPAAEERVQASLAPIPGFSSVEVNRVRPGGKAERLLGRNLRTWLGEHVTRYDFVHLHGVWDPIFPIAASVCRSRSVPYCVMLNGMLDPWSLSQRPLKKKLAMALVYRRMLDGAAFLHIGNADEEQLIGPLRLAAPFEIIPNGVFLQEIDPLPPRGLFSTARRELNGEPYILFLSRIHYKKGLDFLADAFAHVAKEVPNARLVVAGPDGGEEQVFRDRINALGLSARTHVVGPLYGAEKMRAMVDAAVFCLPSRQEGFSMAITEALGCGLPVVISPACHYPEVEEVGAGRIVELEPKAIAQALVPFMRDSALRARSGAAGRALVLSRFTWPSVAAACIAAYERARSRAAPAVVPV
jgi:glycosyltransferase involved in cell wall biosynthesis